MTDSKQQLEPCLSDEIIPDLNNIVRAIEDEGDRCYLGSTNDADRLREIADWLETNFRRTPPASQSDEAKPDQAAAAVIERAIAEAVEKERAQIVAWLRADAWSEGGIYADAIERLKGYAVHDEGCEDNGVYPGSCSCSCGLSRLLKEIGDGQ